MKTSLAILTILLLCHASWSQDTAPASGFLDLRKWNPDEKAVVSLDGEWEFYWNELLLSKDLSEHKPAFAQLSIPWNEQLIDEQLLPKNGAATYHLRILLPAIDSVAFAVPAVFNSYAFFVNDELICSSGKVGLREDDMTPRWRPQTVSVPVKNDTLDVIFQIANFQNTRGGCAEVMRIGSTDKLTAMAQTWHSTGLVVIVLFTGTAVACFIIFFIVRAKSFLYLAMLTLAFAIRFLFSDLYFYYDLAIDLSWAWAARIEYATIPFIILCASLFLGTIYPQEFKRSIRYFFVIFNGILVVVTFLSDSSVFSPLLIVLQVFALFMLLYSIFAILKALIFQRKGAWLTAMGTLVFLSVGFYNVYTFITITDMNRTVIHAGYAAALILNVISLLYRTPMRLKSEQEDMLRFSDFYTDTAEQIKN